MIPRDLRALGASRMALLEKLAPVLRRAGPQHPQRQTINADRSSTRKALRKALRSNADAIAALLMSHLQSSRRRSK